MSFIIVYVTYPDRQTTETIVSKLLEQRIIACSNFFPITSTYWWGQSLDSSDEIVSILKTRMEHWTVLQEEIGKLHPYEIPCIIKMEVEANQEYEKWVYKETETVMSKQVVSLFKDIRDIPYQIPLTEAEDNNCCAGKVKRLKIALENLGHIVRYRVCTFRWSETNLPDTILAIPHDDHSTHVYLEMLLDNLWINIDPTWDTGLNHIFQIASWDGESSTTIAVKPILLFNEEESRKIMEESDPKDMESDLAINRNFYQALNTYFENTRKL